mmetsp:Transcript_50769/g.127383  ORF Transcript_50769/g.127383 Transcript_50769/m.127383 type:complete len:204 (+) Transcript_50769:1004-1615(+)
MDVIEMNGWSASMRCEQFLRMIRCPFLKQLTTRFATFAGQTVSSLPHIISDGRSDAPISLTTSSWLHMGSCVTQPRKAPTTPFLTNNCHIILCQRVSTTPEVRSATENFFSKALFLKQQGLTSLGRHPITQGHACSSLSGPGFFSRKPAGEQRHSRCTLSGYLCVKPTAMQHPIEKPMRLTGTSPKPNLSSNSTACSTKKSTE